jgi:hypothetical protein
VCLVCGSGFFTVFVLLLVFRSFSGRDSFAGAKYVSDDDNDSKDGAKYAGFGGASGNARPYNERSLGPAEGIGLTPVAAGPGVGVYAVNKNVINIEKYVDVFCFGVSIFFYFFLFFSIFFYYLLVLTFCVCVLLSG